MSAVLQESEEGVNTSEISLRPMSIDDLPEIIAIEQSAYPHPWILRIFRDCLRIGYSCWVLAQGRVVVGYGVLSIATGESHILNLCVHPDFQGQGLGKQMLAMKEIGFDAYGLEPSEPFYQRAIDKMGIDAKKLKLAMVENAEYDDDFFDFISFGVVLEHLYDPAAAIEKTLKWLKPGGLIHIEVPSARWLTNALVNRYYKMRGSDYVANLSPMHEPFHLYEFDIRSFQNLSRKLNFKIEHHEYFVCKTYLPKALDPFVIPYMRSTNRGMQLSVWLKKT